MSNVQKLATVPLNIGAAELIASTGVPASIKKTLQRKRSSVEIDYELRGAGYVTLRIPFNQAQPDNFAFSFDIEGEGLPNTLEVKLVDETGKDVWWARRSPYQLSKEKTRLTYKRRHFTSAWGRKEPLKEIAAIEIAIAALNGGAEIEELLTRVTSTQKRVLELLFGLNGYETLSAAAVAHRHGVSAQAITQAAKRAIEAMNRPLPAAPPPPPPPKRRGRALENNPVAGIAPDELAKRLHRRLVQTGARLVPVELLSERLSSLELSERELLALCLTWGLTDDGKRLIDAEAARILGVSRSITGRWRRHAELYVLHGTIPPRK